MSKHKADKSLVGRVKKAVKKTRRKLSEEQFDKELQRTIGFFSELKEHMRQLREQAQTNQPKVKPSKPKAKPSKPSKPKAKPSKEAPPAKPNTPSAQKAKK